MARWAALVLTVLPAGCDSEGTVNNDDVQLATTFRASLSAAGLETNAGVQEFHLSGDGRRVAMMVGATNLHPEDTDGFNDILVKDLPSGSVYLASRATGPSGA